MKIKPMVRNNVCLNCHPIGCEELVQQQIGYVQAQSPQNPRGFRKVLVIGGSTGYGLGGRIAAAYGWNAATLNVSFEKEGSEKRPGSVGLYNTKAFEKQARADGKYAESIYGDAFSQEIKQQTARKIAADLGEVDLVLYSIASPVRPDPETGELYRSVLKPIGSTYTATSLNLKNRTLEQVSIEPADENEIQDTVKVMGGEDWQDWMSVLRQAGVLAPGCVTLALSYIGPEITTAVYRDGTIGQAKKHLEKTAHSLSESLKDIKGTALVSVNKALVTRSSAVIPVVPLYLGVLFKVMQQKGLHEGCVQQMYRLFNEKLSGDAPQLDEQGRIRLDDYEMRQDVQREVMEIWHTLSDDNLKTAADIDMYEREFMQIHGFGFDNVDYEQDTPVQLGFEDEWVK
ncbi:enoyl-ACP reductase FabV [Spirochaeta africana]|uniref:Trans-2-enoyl-CoA reductase [NADH] n=1 Tax=Spirochaeta africana (strain ATCC 700263 / DSM 8902 / Z-7692) TaxID=889378 RepID=H9UIZ3_SPIAZ|nr:enoyl-ACP reductase FabV [Spirochaeta africana]AFG37486.1 putative paraquat-inducible protein B [Spirochaeta africana DSM 8902]